MPKERQYFRRRDLMRAVRAVRDCGLTISGLRISPQGQIEVETARDPAQDSSSDLEHWLASKGKK